MKDSYLIKVDNRKLKETGNNTAQSRTTGSRNANKPDKSGNRKGPGG